MSQTPPIPTDEEAETATLHGGGDASTRLLPVHPPGMMIGHYEIRRFVGQGGHGLVYEAALREADGTVRDLALKQTYLAEFDVLEWEWAMLHRLTHPNLPRYYEAFRVGWFGYLAMEFVYGLDLKTLLAHVGSPLGERQAIQYGIALCDAVHALHSQEPPLLHRDIKPANIRLTPSGQIKLVDFGLAKIACDITLTQQRGASLAYASWEQLTQTAPTDVRSDVYGIGATLYHLLTNRIPTGSLTRRQEGTDPLIPPEQLNSLLSKTMGAVIHRAMHRTPSGRYPSVTALRAALQAIDDATRAPQPRSSRLTGIVTGVSVLILSVAAFVGVGWAATTLVANREATAVTRLPIPTATIAGIAGNGLMPPLAEPSATATGLGPTRLPVARITFQGSQGELLEWVSLRVAPLADAAILAELRSETEQFELVAITDDKGWYLIERADGVRGYVSAGFIVMER